MDRREFLETVTYLSALTFLGACGPEATSLPSASVYAVPRTQNAVGAVPGTRVEISENHGHVLTIPEADISARVEKTYRIQGSASHDHEVTFTPKDFAILAAGGSIVELTTLEENHAHQITLSRTDR